MGSCEEVTTPTWCHVPQRGHEHDVWISTIYLPYDPQY